MSKGVRAGELELPWFVHNGTLESLSQGYGMRTDGIMRTVVPMLQRAPFEGRPQAGGAIGIRGGACGSEGSW